MTLENRNLNIFLMTEFTGIYIMANDKNVGGYVRK
jgi:hypothetical protein